MLKDLFAKLAGGGIITAAESIGNVIDKFVETPEEKNAAEVIKQKLKNEPMLAQIEVNKVEGQHSSWFVAGWRPYIGWVAGTALAIYYIPQFLVATAMWFLLCWRAVYVYGAETLPAYPISGADLLELVAAMLGLGVLRSIEKAIGVAR